jgi:hypothetical protein
VLTLAEHPASSLSSCSSPSSFEPSLASSPATSPEIRVDLLIAEAAYIVVAPRLRALAASEIEPVRGDVQLAAVFALGVAHFLERPAVHARFARLRGLGEVAEAAASLDHVALAAWYARHRVSLESGARPPPLVPVALVDEAMELRGRLLRAAERWPDASAEEARALAQIRPARSCEDLAFDLLELARWCAAAAGEVLSPREPPFCAGDATRAQKLGAALLEHLEAMPPAGATSFRAMQARAWSLLLRTYEEVRRAGLFLFGAEGERRFPPLVDVARKIREPVPMCGRPA